MAAKIGQNVELMLLDRPWAHVWYFLADRCLFLCSKYVRLYAWTTSRIERSMFLYQWSLWCNRTKYRCASVWQPWQTVVVRHRTQTCLALSAYVASRQSTSMQRRRAIDMRIACKDSSDHVHLTSRRHESEAVCTCRLSKLPKKYERLSVACTVVCIPKRSIGVCLLSAIWQHMQRIV